MKMFADDARGILDGRGIVGKGGHAGAEHAMQIMKWRMGELANGGGGPKYLAKQSDGMCLTAKTVALRPLCPTKPERFPSLSSEAISFGGFSI